MAEQLSFDTCFLIDLQREKLAGQQGNAHRFLHRHQGAVMALSSIALGEFAEGFSTQTNSLLQELVCAIQILDIDAATGWLYAENARRLRRAGQLIGSNDLWIGCCSVRHRTPLISRDTSHFRRIEGLELMQY